MKTHKSTSQRKEKKGEEKRRDNKKLRKQEQRLQERLQKAQEEQTQAQKRLERAEARLQKRITQVQCLEESLAQVHERLGIGAEIESGITSALAVQPEPSSVSLNEEPLSIPSADTAPDDSSITVVSLFSAQTSEDIPVIEEVAVEA